MLAKGMTVTVEYTIEAGVAGEPPLNEPATVWATASGAPERLVWRSRRFLVHAKPIPWIDRVEWWMLEQRAARGSFPPLERRMWQVQIRAIDNGEIMLIDLEAGEDRTWQVTGVYA